MPAALGGGGIITRGDSFLVSSLLLAIVDTDYASSEITGVESNDSTVISEVYGIGASPDMVAEMVEVTFVNACLQLARG